MPSPSAPRSSTLRRRLAATAATGVALGLLATVAPAAAQTVPSTSEPTTTTPSTTTTTSRPTTTTTRPTTTTTRPTTTTTRPTTTTTTRPPVATQPSTTTTTTAPPSTTTAPQRDFSFLPPQPADAVYVRPIVFPVIGDVSWTDTYLAPRSDGRRHEGQDLMGKKMQPLVAAVDGTVVVLRHEASGNSLYLKGEDGWYYDYLHINNDTPGTDDGANRFDQAFAPGLAVGSRVRKGQLVAYMGDSGNAEGTGAHLHFEIRMPNASVWNASAVNAAPSLRAAADPGAFPTPSADAFEPWTSPGPFIAQQSEDTLDRPISERGLPTWKQRLGTGEVTAEEAIQELLALPESLGPMGSVSRLWLATYDRMPDRNLILWARRLRAGGSLVTQAEAYLAKPELQSRFGGSDTEFATTALTRVLERAPTPAEVDAALVWTRAGASRAELLVIISQSDTAKVVLHDEMLLIMVFEAMLRRGPTESTYGTWLNRLEQPEGYTNLVRTIRTGSAYADRF